MKSFCVLTVFTGILTINSCITVEKYAQAEQDLCDCLSGIKAPADEFCMEWSNKADHTLKRLDRKMARMSVKCSAKYEIWLLKLNLVKSERDSCLAAISRFRGK